MTTTKNVELKRGTYDGYYPISKIKDNDVNRDCVHSHSKKFQQKLTENNWLMPIVISTKGDLIEGQHRLFGAKTLGQKTVPVYIVDWIDTSVRKNHLTSIISLNNGNRAWKPLDYLKSFREENADYKYVYNLYKKHSNNISLGNIIVAFFGKRGNSKDFRDGLFTIKNKEASLHILRKIVEINSEFGNSKVIAYCVRDIIELCYDKEYKLQSYILEKYRELLETESPIATNVTELKPLMIKYINRFNSEQ